VLPKHLPEHVSNDDDDDNNNDGDDCVPTFVNSPWNYSCNICEQQMTLFILMIVNVLSCC